MQKISGLGRGLSSLIPIRKDKNPEASEGSFAFDTKTKSADQPSGDQVAELPVDKISPNPYQPRANFADAEMRELIDSIKEHGLIQPIIVIPKGDGWQIIAGERRFRAVKALGQKRIAAMIRDFDDQKKLEISLIENLQRENLNALETAMAYQRLIDEFNLSYDEVAAKVGKSKSAVVNTLRLLNAADEVKEAIRSGQISEGHARTLVALPLEDQLALLRQFIAERMSVRAAEKASREVVVKKHIRNIHIDPELLALTEKLEQALGTKVDIKRSGRAGQIMIKFYSDEELNGLMQKIIG